MGWVNPARLLTSCMTHRSSSEALLFLVMSHNVPGVVRDHHFAANWVDSTSLISVQSAASTLGYPNAMVPCYVAQLVIWHMHNIVN